MHVVSWTLEGVGYRFSLRFNAHVPDNHSPVLYLSPLALSG